MKAICLSLALFFSATCFSQQLFTVYFELDKYKLTQSGQAKLDEFITEQKENIPSLEIYLHGYCDPRGSDGYNDRLSKQRVNTVKKYLLSNGIPAANILNEKAHGERVQLNENSNEDEMAMNRRVQVSFTTTGNPPVTLKDKIADTTTIAGSNIVLRNINFYGGMHQFLPESTPMLEELLDAMRSYPNLVIRVEGHICCQEGDIDGLDNETGIRNLSAARATAVMDYLVENNIAADRVTSKGFGHSQPLFAYPEKTEEEKTQNRRVEIKIIRK
jgi:outer membrane protein OmpA-like peptidoglycan-associated protein